MTTAAECPDTGICLDVKDPKRAWIITYTGKKFYHLQPTPEMVCIEDIAHSLSMLCRWTGHTRFHYSVAQHSVYASYLVPDSFKLSALLHDASEAYLGDMNRPLKHFTQAGPAYKEIEEQVEPVIFEKFGVPYPMPEEVKTVDTALLYAEKAQLMNVTEATAYEARKWGRDETPAQILIAEWTLRFAEKTFLERFQELKENQ